jgi:hypothetical protein
MQHELTKFESESPSKQSAQIRLENQHAGMHRIVTIICVFVLGCRSQMPIPKPSIEIVGLPPASLGGPEQMVPIEGRAVGATSGERVIVYAKNDIWWVQPFKSRPFTTIESDSTWKTSTHLGSEYAALLVDPDFHPQPRLAELPRVGEGVKAVVSSKGGAALPGALKTIHFSGYDWTVRAAASDRGGETHSYDPANAWTDNNGYLHLRMGEREGNWSCAQVNLTRSLGYGTYKFVVQDSSRLATSGVLGLFTLDERRPEDTRIELDIELSQWGIPGSKNAQYVIQPYYIPENIARFDVPPGIATHILRWEPGFASFKTFHGAVESVGVKSVSEHAFTSGIPAPAAETVHIDLYDFFHSKSSLRHPIEVVIEKFEYLP